MDDFLDEQINKYFAFLNSEYLFNGPYRYNIAYEEHRYYVKNKIIVDIGFAGGYSCSVIKLKKEMMGLVTGEISLRDVDYKLKQSYELCYLLEEDRRFIYNTREIPFYKKYVSAEDQIEQFSKIIKRNSEMLEGNFYIFSLRYMILYKLKQIAA